MQRLQFTVSIQAPAEKVYNNMLGLQNKSTYEYWTTVFNPTSTFEGNWDKGSKILFIGTDEQGKRAGMVSFVEENTVVEKVVVRHLGIVDGDKEITEGPMVDQWAGGYEIYTFEAQDDATLVTVDIDAMPEHLSYFETHYPLALDKLKTLCEQV
jgi:hypothetical protein